MSDNDFNFQLDLLVPWDIPLDYQLDIETKEKLNVVLTILLRSLKETSLEIALQEIDTALDYLGEVEINQANISYTQTPLKGWEVTDYDRYFQINRIQSKEPALILVKGLLVNCRTFFLLCQSNNSLNPIQIDIQKKGFASYTHLLARSFQLNI